MSFFPSIFIPSFLFKCKTVNFLIQTFLSLYLGYVNIL
jgi:hypothetical protein